MKTLLAVALSLVISCALAQPVNQLPAASSVGRTDQTIVTQGCPSACVTRYGTVTQLFAAMVSGDVTAALGFTPFSSASTIPVVNGGTGATTASGARTNLGLGSSATVNTGTSGATIPLLNTSNQWSANQVFTKALILSGRIISSGSTDTATTTDNVIVWDSASGSAKTETLPTCAIGIAGNLIIITDEFGDANTHNITLAPSAGTINGAASITISASHGSAQVMCVDPSNQAWQKLN